MHGTSTDRWVRPLKHLLPSLAIALAAVLAVSPRAALAQFDGGGGGGEEAAIAAVFIVIGLIALAVSLAIIIALCWFLSSCYKRIPPQYRLMEPGQVWLMLIPCFNIVWIFFVYPRLAKSFKAYFNAHGVTDVGDCGEQIGLWYCICVVVSIIPLVNYIAGPASLVLLIIFLVKAAGLKGRIPEGATA
jgi:hypothetical protein